MGLNIRFRDFLKKEKAHDAYVINFKKEYRGVVKTPSVKKFLESCPPKQWVRYAFVFSQTKEGERYWVDVQEKWHDLLDQNNCNKSDV